MKLKIHYVMLPTPHNISFRFHLSQVDVACTVSTRISHLVGKDRTVRLCTKINKKIIVQLQSSIFSVYIYNEHHGALITHLGVELLVPGGEQGGGHVQPLTIQAKLQHLRSAFNPLSFCVPYSWLNRELLVLGNLDIATFLNGSTQEHLSCQLRIPGVSDVVLPDVAMEPVGKVEVFIIHTDDDISHHPWHFWQDPPLNLLTGNINHFLCCPVSRF